jgi:SAM-dependent methyltransferase
METKIHKFTDFNHSFDYFDMCKYKSNEYAFHVEGFGKASTRAINTFIIEELCEKVINFGNHLGLTIVKDEAVKRFHPNEIDNKAFWVRAHESFPLLSVCGGECKNIKEANQKTRELSTILNLYPFLLKLIEDSTKPLKIFEIGFGYGNVFNEIKDKCEYIGIDYVIPKSLKKYKNFIEIQKSGIPEYLWNEKYFNVIYSVNVLQHCSQKDRFDYFEQGYSALKPGGYFLFSCNLMTIENMNETYWGVKDKMGRGYLHFFNQLTETDFDSELFNYLHKLGYKPINSWLIGNIYSAIIQKPKR